MAANQEVGLRISRVLLAAKVDSQALSVAVINSPRVAKSVSPRMAK